MEDKEFSTTKKITQELIGGWLLWAIPFGIIYFVIYNLLTRSIESLILKAVIAIVMQGVLVFFIWKFSTKSTFKKRTMSRDNVSKVMKNLIIFTVVICIIDGIYQVFQVNKAIEESIESNVQLKYAERMMSYMSSDEQRAEYNKQKENTIAKAKTQAYIYLAIIEVGLTAVYLAVLPLEKKEISKYVS